MYYRSFPRAGLRKEKAPLKYRDLLDVCDEFIDAQLGFWLKKVTEWMDQEQITTLPRKPVEGQVRVASRSISPPWGSIRFRLAPRTYDAPPWGVRVVSQTKSRKIPTRKILPLFFASRHRN